MTAVHDGGGENAFLKITDKLLEQGVITDLTGTLVIYGLLQKCRNFIYKSKS